MRYQPERLKNLGAACQKIVKRWNKPPVLLQY